jgi:glycosyltransferase involved in cell wall biosynthesis
MKLSIIIPCYNAEATLGMQLKALTHQRWSEPWEILLVDNRSTDRSRAIAKSYQTHLPHLRIIDASARQGQPFALNTGIQAAHGESVAICDADDEVAPGWVAAMGDALARHDFVACRLDTKKLNPSWWHGHEQESGLQRIWYPPWMPHAGGGTIGFSKKLYEQVGEFDHSLPYLHDTDFCFRAQMLGHTLHFVPDAVLYVRGRDSLWGHYRQSKNMAEYNVILAKRYRRDNDSVGNYYTRFMTDWFRLLRRTRSLRTRGGQFAWIWSYGRQVGRLKGLLSHSGVPV